ncbi:hypothetical protein OA249_01705 [Litorivicinus sp.]|nr:hypothetical protein [Litorivicinus sp.]
MSNEVVVLSAARSAIGTYGVVSNHWSPKKLGATVLAEAIRRLEI